MGDVSAQFFAASPEEREDGGERTDAPRDPRGGCGSDGHPPVPLRHTRLAIRPPSRAKAATICAAFALPLGTLVSLSAYKPCEAKWCTRTALCTANR
jgi:hypothetical protein